MDKLIQAINHSGTTHLIISKVDIAIEVGTFKYYFHNVLHESPTIEHMKENVVSILKKNTHIEDIVFSSNPTEI
jgi:hypothetical protein